jgi:hypothetical protein
VLRGQRPNGSRQCFECLGALLISVGTAQHEVGLITATQENVTGFYVSRDVLRVPEKIRKLSFNYAHGSTISEVVQISKRGGLSYLCATVNYL